MEDHDSPSNGHPATVVDKDKLTKAYVVFETAEGQLRIARRVRWVTLIAVICIGILLFFGVVALWHITSNFDVLLRR